jgi:hypothetical protein
MEVLFEAITIILMKTIGIVDAVAFVVLVTIFAAVTIK